ncbi:unnamed protein product, partial [Symbiodinium pilosum]
KTGASFGESLGSSGSTSLATDRIIHAIDGLRKAQDEDKTGTKGTLTSVKEPEKLDVFLARGCGETQVELCPGVYGKELFHGIKRAVEAWNPPTDHRLEQRCKAPAAFLTWLRYAENAVKVFGTAYGLEHVPERLAFLSFLREANEEAIRESRRQLCAKLGTENPRLEDLKLIALAPNDDGTPNFQFPRVWDLKDPQGYFQTVVLPRQQRAMTRLLNKQLHEQALGSNRRPNKAAGADTGSYEDEVETDPKAGKPAPEDDPPEAAVTACPKTSCSATYSGGAVHLTSKLYPKGLSLPFEDHLDKLEVKEGSPPLFGAAPAMESRQCLCLHVGRVFAPDPSQAVALAQDLRGELSEAQGYLGDAAPMISEAEAFVRHNAHDCLAPHHEKDYRVLQLFAPSFMSGRVLVVLRVVRDLEAQGWASFLESGEGVGADSTTDRPDWDPAEVPEFPSTRLQDRPSFKHGQEVFAGWAGWTDPQAEHDLTKAPVVKRLRDLAAATPAAPGVPNFWQFGSLHHIL